DGRYGVAVMDMNAYGTQAKKAWFSFKDEMVALGAGIASTRSEYVNTSVNQTRLNGPVTVDGVVYEKGSRALVNASWVHHDGIGYVFPAYWYGHMNNQTQSGN
ncbi:polysaccharide lyase family 8 super-sandwich domain-containing protein, partial [Vibrio vulnificus]